MASRPPPRLFCLGLGYCARHLAPRLEAHGFTIAGTSRDPAALRASLDAAGIGRDWQLFPFSEQTTTAELEAALAGTTHLLHSIMPDGATEPDTAAPDAVDPVLRHHAGTIEALLQGELRWIGYLSTTGVYGDHDGAWVDEDSPRRPSKARTHRRVVAEDQWLARGAQVFRLAGIYGPGRSALERAEAGAPRIVAPGKIFNRIHVDDIAAILEAAILEHARPDPDRHAAAAEFEIERERGQAFNVADNHPASSDEVLAHAAALLGLPPPPAVPLETAEMSPTARSFWQDNVRIDARRVLERFRVHLRHPDYRAGLRACLDARSRESKDNSPEDNS
ncbi:MAG: hypothetical protein KC457_05950 [Myxococcales bacterium]|nr:hypothetical protein [Myxococcales bacterium]